MADSTAKFCEWKFVEGNLWKCELCGGRWNGKKPKERVCPTSLPKRITPRPSPAPAARGCCGGKTTVQPKPLEVKKPAMLQRALTFAKEMATWSLEGFPLTSETRRESRHLACSQCKFRDGEWCGGCGCYLPFAEKVETKHCPIALWPGDSENWTPQVHDDWLKKVLVIMPVCGNDEFTKNALADCDREGISVNLIDGCQSGWLRGTNKGLAEGLKGSYDFFVLLNNDVRLSRGFFAGLLIAHVQTGADMLTACYSAGWQPQRPTHQDQPSADQYKPRPVHRQLPAADGTCVMLTRRLVETCGYLDDEKFSKYGHSATGDLGIRAKMRGMEIYVTEAAYCYHFGMQTAIQIHGDDYMKKAQEEARLGMIEKWGENFVRYQGENRLLPPKSSGIEVRNLCYHVYPKGDMAWWNLEQLLRHIDLFNGKRVACIATGSGLDIGRATDILAPYDFTILFRKNCQLYDSVGIMDMLGAVQSVSPNEATFVAHTKGASRANGKDWAAYMYDQCLGNSEEAMEALKDYACAGTMIQLQLPDPPIFRHKCPWHYSGSFYWLRHDATFSRDWRINPLDRYFIEAFPGMLFESFEAYNIGAIKQETPWT